MENITNAIKNPIDQDVPRFDEFSVEEWERRFNSIIINHPL